MLHLPQYHSTTKMKCSNGRKFGKKNILNNPQAIAQHLSCLYVLSFPAQIANQAFYHNSNNKYLWSLKTKLKVMNRSEYFNSFAVCVSTKMLKNARLVKIACLFLMVVTISQIYFYPKTKVFSETIVGGKLCINVSSVTSDIIINERYQLMDQYEQDRLLDGDPTFKRILFWNDVT